MKLSRAFILLVGLGILGPGIGPLIGQGETEAKIRLMSEALNARDSGDLPTAKAKLEALLNLAPQDPSVRRLLAEVDRRLAEQKTMPARPLSSPEPVGSSTQDAAAAPPTTTLPLPSPPNSVMPFVPDEQELSKESAESVQAAPNPYAEAMARVEAAALALARAEVLRLERTTAYVEAQRALAQLYAQEKNHLAAIAAIDAALKSLDKPSQELQAERREYARRHQESLPRRPSRSPFVRP